MNTNPMLPYPGKLVEVRDLAAEIKLLRVELAEPGAETFKGWQPGQFAFVSAYGLGEAPFGIANMSQDGSLLDFAVARLGSVTTGLHELGEGDTVGVRGPLGNCFPMDKFKGKNLVVLGGGIGGAPLRPVIQTVLSQRLEFGSLNMINGGRLPTPGCT
jgi:NAD(P)H-flavin reductase